MNKELWRKKQSIIEMLRDGPVAKKKNGEDW